MVYKHEGFNAIGSCVRKSYTYLIYNDRIRNPFYVDRVWFYSRHLDEAVMQAAADQFVGTHDFAAVRSVGTDVRSTVRTVYQYQVQRQGKLLALTVSADGFLYNMARAMAAAFTEACQNMKETAARVSKLRDQLLEGLSQIPLTIVNGDTEHRLPGNVNVCFQGIEGESLLLLLDAKGIEASSGSACTSGSLDPSHVLLALGLPHEVAHGSLRLSLSGANTQEDVDYMLQEIPQVVSYLRSISPVWEAIEKGEIHYAVQ